MTMPTMPNGKDTRTPMPARTNADSGEATTPAGLPVELATLPDDVLAALARASETEIARRLEERRAAALAALRAQAEVAQALGIPLARLKAHLGGKDDGTLTAAIDGKAADGSNIGGRAVVAPKYRNPKNHDETWSGRGNAPKWYADALASGMTEEALRIPDDDDE
jgi:DNA-binding protein H-NS